MLQIIIVVQTSSIQYYKQFSDVIRMLNSLHFRLLRSFKCYTCLRMQHTCSLWSLSFPFSSLELNISIDFRWTSTPSWLTPPTSWQTMPMNEPTESKENTCLGEEVEREREREREKDRRRKRERERLYNSNIQDKSVTISHMPCQQQGSSSSTEHFSP